jgi:hypothetical protein
MDDRLPVVPALLHQVRVARQDQARLACHGVAAGPNGVNAQRSAVR